MADEAMTLEQAGRLFAQQVQPLDPTMRAESAPNANVRTKNRQEPEEESEDPPRKKKPEPEEDLDPLGLDEEEEPDEDEPDEEDTEESDDEADDGADDVDDDEEESKSTRRRRKTTSVDDDARIEFETGSGEKRTIKYSELKELARKGVDYEGKAELLGIEQQKVQRALTDYKQQFDYQVYQAAQSLHFSLGQIEQQKQAIEAYKLSNSPAYWEARSTIDDQEKALRAQQAQLDDHYKRTNQDMMDKLKLYHREAILRRRPDITVEKHGKAINDTLLKAGYDVNELPQLVDHRLLILALEHSEMAQKLANIEKGRKLNEAKARKKAQKPTAQTKGTRTKKKEAPKSKQRQVLESRLERSGTLGDAASLFSAMQKG